jgi:pyruvate ferredoxin oxidoreductase alpha subunit
MTRALLTGNAAAAWGARLAGVDYIPAFPITPQTEIIETLSRWLDQSEMSGRMVTMDSEHSMITAAGAAAATGVRVFSATSLEPDHNDVLAARDSGWLQIHCATCQEVLDTVLIAYRLAEDMRVRLPVMVNQDGFYLSFTREPVEIPETDAVSNFVGSFDPGDIRFRASQPLSQAVAVLGGSTYSYFRYETHMAALNAVQAYDEIAAEFLKTTGRDHPAVESYRTDDADFVFVMMGSFATKAKAAVDQLRAAGWKIGLLRPRLIRPFPAERFRSLLAGKKVAAVIDQNLSIGSGGILFTEVSSAASVMQKDAPIFASFIGGLGGRDITAEDFAGIADAMKRAAETGTVPPPRLLYTEDELREVRKLQAVAAVEREELEDRP